jgi:hypothetical protein
MKIKLMPIFHILLTAGLLVMTGCKLVEPDKLNDESESDEIPAWLDERIEDFKKQPPTSPPMEISRWQYEGETVYYFPPYCCDIFGDLYDNAGTLLCHPDGGIAGNGDGRCSDFLDKRTDGEIVWLDERKE